MKKQTKQSSTSVNMVAVNPVQNRLRLVQQNAKLFRQIKQLQTKVSTVIEVDVSKQVQNQIKKHQVSMKTNEIVMQQTYLKRLKAKIRDLKGLNLIDVSQGIVGEQNQLTLMKKEYQNYQQEKRTLTKKIIQKQVALNYNKPLNDFKTETQSQMAKIKKNNVDMAAKIVQLDRQVRKYHKILETHKKIKNDKSYVENPEYQISKIEHERNSAIKRVKLFQQKWRPHIEALDNQYFQSKQILIKREKEVIYMEKQLKNWQNRASAVRSESDVLLDRERLSKVQVIAPIKTQKKNTFDNSKIQRIQENNGNGITDFFKNLFSKNNEKQDAKQKEDQKLEVPSVRKWLDLSSDTRYATQSQKVNVTQEKFTFTKLSEKNQFMNNNKSFEILTIKQVGRDSQIGKSGLKNKLLMNSVGVGTSFYYNDQD